MKVCKKCGELKPLSEYSFKRPKNRKPGLQPRCKTCAAQDTKEWNIKNEHRRRELYLQRTYGISENEYNAMLLSQNNSCVLCGREFSDVWGSDAPVVDHCHTTGKVRGILCNECNRGLGYFHDNIKALENAVDYLRSNNAIPEKWSSPV